MKVTAAIKIKAPPGRIWKAITDKEQMKEWYFDIPDFELKEGTVFNFYEPGGKREFHHQCRILQIDPDKKFSHTWTHPSHSRGSSVVTWQLYEKGDNLTEVVLTHDGIESLADGGPAFVPENYQLGWEGFMAILKNYIYGIRKHVYEIDIDVPAEKVWQVLLDDKSFRIWRSTITDGAYYAGELKQGRRIHLLTPDGSGKYGYVVLLDEGRNILIQLIGEIREFKEQAVDLNTERWSGIFENYVLNESNGKTKLVAEIDVIAGQAVIMDAIFPEAMKRIKLMAEQNLYFAV